MFIDKEGIANQLRNLLKDQLIKFVLKDVTEECNKHGGVSHIYLDKASTQAGCPSLFYLYSKKFLFNIIDYNIIAITLDIPSFSHSVSI